MQVQMIEKRVLSSDKIHMLAGRVYIPEGEVRGLFQLVHGMMEHIGRYDAFLRKIAEQGYIAFAYDQLGHGHTVNDPSEYGYIAKKDGWKHLVEDVAVYAKEIKRQFGEELPYYLMGHSMGSFVARLAAEKFDMEDKLIIMGTSGPVPMSEGGVVLARMVKRVRGGHYISKPIDKIMFGAYNKKFGRGDPHLWLSTMESTRKAYANDPLCQFRFTISGMQDLAMMVKLSNRKNWFSSGVSKKPILLLSGSEDPVGDYGKGIRIIEKKLRENGAHPEVHLYEGCRHEILNDYRSGQVIRDILQFINGYEQRE